MAIPPKRQSKQEGLMAPSSLNFVRLTPGGAHLEDTEGEIHVVAIQDINAIAPLFSFPGGYTALQTVAYRRLGQVYWDPEIEQEAATGVRDSFLRALWLKRLHAAHLDGQPIPF